MKRITCILILGFGLILILACGEADPFFETKQYFLDPPVALKSKTVFVNTSTDQAILLDSTMTSNGDTIRVNLPKAPIYMERRAGDHDQVIILTRGHTGNANQLQKVATLSLLDSTGALKVIELGNNPFDTIVSDPEGKYLFLLRKRLVDALIENINEVAIVQLDAAPEAINSLVYRTLTSTPQSVFFSENFKIGGEPRKIACVVSTNMLFLFDMENLHRRATSVYLGQNNAVPIVAEQIIFDEFSSRIYVRSPESNDVFALKLTPRVADEDRNDFATAIDIIGVGDRPTDMSSFYEEGNSKLFVVAEASAESYIVDVPTGKTISIHFPGPIDRVHLFTRSELGSETRHALVWKTGAREFFIIDFYNVEELLERNIRSIGYSFQPAKELLPIIEGNRLLLMHYGVGLSIIDLDTESISPFVSKSPLTDSFLDEARGRFWLAPVGQRRIAFVDITQGNTDDMLLDSDVLGVVPVFESGTLLIRHIGAAGYVTLIDVTNPNRNNSRTISGFLLEDII
ncbi:MAG: hypothetical protein QNJ97_25405 [Myxococcota bacterium]|nr:hypothetical protein [Myxococcota bacterium]